MAHGTPGRHRAPAPRAAAQPARRARRGAVVSGEGICDKTGGATPMHTPAAQPASPDPEPAAPVPENATDGDARGDDDPRQPDRSPTAGGDARERQSDVRIGIMRHARAFRPGMDPGQRAGWSRSLTWSGVNDARPVASRLAETLSGMGHVTVACAPTPEAKATSAELTRQLNAPDPLSLETLDPADWPAADDKA